MTRDFSTVAKTNSIWFVADNDYQEIISSKDDVEIDGHTFEVRNIKTDNAYVHSFATGISVKPISDFKAKDIEYDARACEELYEQGVTLSDDITEYTEEVTFDQYQQWFKDEHYSSYLKYTKDKSYNLYNSDKVSANDLKQFLIQPIAPDNNPFEDYVKSHGNFMKKNCQNTFYAYDTIFNDYCILHLICGETKENPFTKDQQTKVYGVQKYCIDQETGKVNKLFILGKPHVEVFQGTEDENIVFCVESYVKAFTLWNSLKKKYTIITTHRKLISHDDLRWINENFKNYDLGILCDTDSETSEVVLATRNKYEYLSAKNLKSIFGIMGNKQGKDINDSSRTAINMCKRYLESLTRFNTFLTKIGG